MAVVRNPEPEMSAAEVEEQVWATIQFRSSHRFLTPWPDVLKCSFFTLQHRLERTKSLAALRLAKMKQERESAEAKYALWVICHCDFSIV
jgi:hypothetical protein